MAAELVVVVVVAAAAAAELTAVTRQRLERARTLRPGQRVVVLRNRALTARQTLVTSEQQKAQLSARVAPIPLTSATQDGAAAGADQEERVLVPRPQRSPQQHVYGVAGPVPHENASAVAVAATEPVAQADGWQ
jgi:hypothetical protein